MELEDSYTQWNKSDRQKQISYDLSYMKSIYTKKTKLREIETRLMTAIGRDEGGGGDG